MRTNRRQPAIVSVADNLERQNMAPNSLFRNILRVKSLESRFCTLQIGHPLANHKRINILRELTEKIDTTAATLDRGHGPLARIVYNLRSFQGMISRHT
jgi:hypothetical protein